MFNLAPDRSDASIEHLIREFYFETISCPVELKFVFSPLRDAINENVSKFMKSIFITFAAGVGVAVIPDSFAIERSSSLSIDIPSTCISAS